VRRVRRFAPANADRCTRRGKRRQGHVRWALARPFRPREPPVPAAGLVVPQGGPASVMFRAA
jgi:hypothetical protein